MTDVRICEMSPRDGLQFLGHSLSGKARKIPLDMKRELIELLLDSGLSYIEIGSFVPPHRVPQMADTRALAATLNPASDVQLAALVPNLRYYQMFRSSRLDTVALMAFASEQHSRANRGRSVSESLECARQVASAARDDGKSVRAHLSDAFGDLTDRLQPSDIVTLTRAIRELLQMGCEYVTLADTHRGTTPRRVREVLDQVGTVEGVCLPDCVGVHLHERYGRGLTNAFAAFESGVRIFDASVGGIGGSNAAATATSRARLASCVATEELVALFQGMGVTTGVSHDSLLRAGEIIYAMTRLSGDFQPPSALLREHLGYGEVWQRTPNKT